MKGSQLDFVAIRQFAQGIFGDVRRVKMFIVQFVLETTLYASIETRPFFFGFRVNGEA